MSLVSQPEAITDLLSVPVDLPILDILHNMNIYYKLLYHINEFIQHMVFRNFLLSLGVSDTVLTVFQAVLKYFILLTTLK